MKTTIEIDFFLLTSLIKRARPLGLNHEQFALITKEEKDALMQFPHFNAHIAFEPITELDMLNFKVFYNITTDETYSKLYFNVEEFRSLEIERKRQHIESEKRVLEWNAKKQRIDKNIYEAQQIVLTKLKRSYKTPNEALSFIKDFAWTMPEICKQLRLTDETKEWLKENADPVLSSQLE